MQNTENSQDEKTEPQRRARRAHLQVLLEPTRTYCIRSDQIRSVQSLSRVRLFVTPWIAARQASLSITNSWSSLRLTSIKSVMPSSHLILCRPLLLLPPICSQHQSLFQWVNSSHEVAKVQRKNTVLCMISEALLLLAWIASIILWISYRHSHSFPLLPPSQSLVFIT